MEDLEGETDAAGSIIPTPAATSTKASASKKKSSPRAQQSSATSTPPVTAVASSAQVTSQLASTDSMTTPVVNVSTGAAGEAGGATTEPLAGTSGSSAVSFSLFTCVIYLLYVSGALVASIANPVVVLLP